MKGQIYLTPPMHFNDPWDFLLRSEPPTEEQVKKEDFSLLLPEDLHEFLNHTNSSNVLENEACKQQEGLSSTIGLICLTENPLDRLMWAHYGDSHRGFVAEFRHSEEKMQESNFRICMSPFGGAVKVQYGPELPLLKRDGSNMLEACWTKHFTWEYEQEWRVVESLKKAGAHPYRKGYYLLWFKPTDLIRVILGLRVCPKVKSQLRQMLKHKEFEHVRKEQVYIDAESRKLNSRPLSL